MLKERPRILHAFSFFNVFGHVKGQKMTNVYDRPMSSYRSIAITNLNSEYQLSLLKPFSPCGRQGTSQNLFDDFQVMACCLIAPTHYLNWYRLIMNKVAWHSLAGNNPWNAQGIVKKEVIENYTYAFRAIYIFFFIIIKTYLTRMTHQPEAVLHEVLSYTTQFIT